MSGCLGVSAKNGLTFELVERMLNDQRMDLDRRMAVLQLGADIGCDALWQELEDVLEELEDAAKQLAQVSATRLTEVRAKAEILAMLMRSDDVGDGPVIPYDKTRELALSLTDDLGGLPGGTAASGGRWMAWLPAAVRGAHGARH